ncbi:MAG: UDP-N-acetylglucosamine--N-acetylmuramyl-(pentapeptide) pyrophosphoryl-undecaprenol N-acetylglucosamine transferase [Candidatus Saccharibacteria bacterium]|nr:UDP-N-acetylglucosamine--N-acetylmuramyl-(pentapeptide) pyrophosphoryl-undecaprenol N-acetylglucosamine transferase [Candidatus Saccharibacteria bacterium]
MKILVVGGGSGGHITPAVAVVREILDQKPRAEVEFWTDFKYHKNVTKLTTEIGVSWGEENKSTRRGKGSYIRVRRIPAGKFHRYSNWHFKDYFVHLDVTLKDLIFGNIVGFLGFLGGIITAFCRLARKKSRPNVIFLKGGYVCLPAGLIARLFKIPYIIHESDVVAGLANRLLMRKAKKVAFGMPLPQGLQEKHPNYVWTGIPVGPEFKPVSLTKQRSLKKAFSFNPDKPLVVITGGSQGSENLNEATRQILPELLNFTSVGLVAGRKHYENMVDLKKYENWEKASLESNFRMWEFNTTMNELMGAADVIVSRAGATTIAEMAALKKATILVPFERLPGRHQVKNAERLEAASAAVVVKDADMVANPSKLLEEIRHLIKSPRLRADMADRLAEEARSDAAKRLAEIILEEA